jgi:very-short-patch-repair endonuclease
MPVRCVKFAATLVFTGWIGGNAIECHAPSMGRRPRIPTVVELNSDPWTHLRLMQSLMPGAIFAGRTAAWLNGMRHLDPFDPIEIIAPLRSGMRSRRGLKVQRSDLVAGDVVEVRLVRTTGLDRTLADLCPRLTGVEALAVLDAALALRVADKTALLRSRSRTVRALAPLAEPAESPMETRLRWLLLKAGVPRPEVQVWLAEARARVDLYYPDSRLVIEYDGGNHRDRLVDDNRRQNLLINAGYTVLRFTSSDIYHRPETVVEQVSAAAAVSARRQAAARR